MRRAMDQGDFDLATKIFKNGANADPYAKLSLEEPLARAIESKDLNNGRPIKALGMNELQEPVTLYISRASERSTDLFVMYNDTESGKLCHVGGRSSPITDGCLAAKGGLVVADYGALNYHYSVQDDNKFWASLFGFSEHEAEKMFHCNTKCPYPEYEKFYKYYGQMDYGALWVTAALHGSTTDEKDLSFVHGQEDFSSLAAPGRAAAVETAAITMNVRTQVNRVMTEWAIDACRQGGCSGQGASSSPQCFNVVESWDKAVAHYVGSSVRPNDEGSGGYEPGYLYYGMADELCHDFATCGPNGNDIEGKSAVNHNIIQLFQAGRVSLEKGSCDMAELTYGQITHSMTVPLIQGTLRSAYRLAFTHKNDEERGRAVAYMASILPDLYSCSQQDADILYEELNLSAGKSPDFDKVKGALERNYQCLCITCDDVGGLYNADKGRYMDGASPCGKRRARQSGSKGNMAFGQSTIGRILMTGSVAMAAVLLVVNYQRWAPALASRADSYISRFGANTPVRYHQVMAVHSLQLQPPAVDRDDLDISQISNASYESHSSADYHDMDTGLL